MEDLLLLRREKVNNDWLDATGEELLQLQGEGRALRRTLRLIERGPAIGTNDGGTA